MAWIMTHQEETAGWLLLVVGMIALIFPTVLLPRRKMEQLNKLSMAHLPRPAQKQHGRDRKLPWAVALMIRLTGLLFVFAGAVILLARQPQ